MHREYDIRISNGKVLIGVASDDAVLDTVCSREELEACLGVLDSDEVPPPGDATTLGYFGPFPVSLQLTSGPIVVLGVDGPQFEAGRSLFASIWIDRDWFTGIVREALQVLNDAGDSK